ncbi:MAG: CDP-alcohol phosphatidyltransferase family protein [Deltaproteobacteria bacterium]|nr:CDP-alcohol phosphatidyltransferase family protein [Deltaproteobacteria bacterium]
MNIPNALTILRILLVPVIVIFLIKGAFSKALLVFAVACITDGLDGFLARVLKQKTVLGSHLDPLADKALIVTSYVTLSVLQVIPSWLAVIVISRDFIILLGISVLTIMSVSFEIRPAFVSKVTTVFQFLTIFLVLVFKELPGYGNPDLMKAMYWVTALLTIASGLHYIFEGFRLMNNE